MCLWTNGKPVPPTLVEWWMDFTMGVIKKPIRGGRHDRKSQARDVIIAATVNMVHHVTDLPSEFDETSKPGRTPRTACHSVAERLGMPFNTVRTIWRNNRDYVDLARGDGGVPQARGRRRRT